MDKLMRWTVVITCLFTAVTMTLVLYFSANKVIVVAEDGSFNGSAEGYEKHYLLLSSDQAKENVVSIPISNNVRSEGIRIRNIDLYQGVEISLSGTSLGFYETAPVTVERGVIKEAYCVEENGAVTIRLNFEHVKECSSRINGNTLQIVMQDPKEIYDKIVFVDERPGRGMYQEQAEILTSVASSVKNQLTEGKVKVYETYSEDGVVDDERILRFLEDVPVKLYVKLTLLAGPDQESFGISAFYNEQFFIPTLPNSRFAQMAAYETAVKSQNTILKCEPCSDESILRNIRIPACELSLGCITNEAESEMLGRSDYRAMLSQGVVTAIGDALEVLK